MIDGLSNAQSSQVNQQLGPKNGADSPGPGVAAFEKAESLQKTVASIVTEHQPLEASGSRGRNVNIVT